jgi:hypothetical protein
MAARAPWRIAGKHGNRAGTGNTRRLLAMVGQESIRAFLHRDYIDVL